MASEADRVVAWTARWFDAVTDSSMTQRTLASVERHGGLDALEREARARGLHLLLVTNDEGRQIVAASRWPFRVIC